MASLDYSGCKIEYVIKGGKAEITGCSESKGRVILPDTIEGLPVTSLARYSLANLRQAEEIILPSGLEGIGSLAFYNDRGLKRLDLPKNVYRIGGDALKNCDGIREVVIRSERLLRYVLDELLQELIVVFKDENDRILWKLLFPVSAESFSEDVPGRTFHRTFTGPGYTYRRETAGSSVSFKRYDGLFKRTFEEEAAEDLCLLAVCRLVYPYKLENDAKEFYSRYIEENAFTAVKGFTDKGLFSEIEYLTENRLIPPKAAEEAADYARQRGNAEILSRLMDYRLKNFKPEKKTFEL
ncbi:MAG: leucine-rich repeat domain-containing protein [Clostridiales bacterium]|nr:leucine-rich repeat domain-containing protein [Clostridiales bacterium]